MHGERDGMKRVTILVDSAEGPDDDGDYKFTAPMSGADESPSSTWVHKSRIVSIEDAPAPLPTEPGTVIDATVTQDGESGRARLMLCGAKHTATWRAATPIGTEENRYLYWHKDEHITDWTLVAPAPEVTP